MENAEAIVKRRPGRPPGAKNKPKPGIAKTVVIQDPKKIDQLVAVGINSLHPAPKIAKEIRRLAEATGFTLKRIYDDMCENGIIEIQTMYLEVINARREVSKALEALDGKATLKTPSQPEAEVRNGTTPEGVHRDDRERRPDPRASVHTQEQSNAPDVQRGLSTPPGSDPKGTLTGVEPDFSGIEDPLEDEPEEPEEEVEEPQ